MIRILVPVDDSECALAAVRHAAFLFREGSASEVVLLNVQPALERSRAGAFHSLAELRELESRLGESALSRAMEILDDSDVRYVALIGLGRTASTIAIAADANRCDGIVLGVTIWSQFKACFGGGMPAKIMRRSSVPVTAVKASKAQPAGSMPAQPQPQRTHPHPRLVVYSSAF